MTFEDELGGGDRAALALLLQSAESLDVLARDVDDGQPLARSGQYLISPANRMGSK